jgi:hypothetical protein
MMPSWMLQGGSPSSTFQGSNQNIQGSSPTLQAGNSSGQSLQPAVAPPPAGGGISLGGAGNAALGATTQVSAGVDPAVAAAQAKAAADAARSAQLRGQITNIANTIKDIFNSRYGQVDASAQEQTGKLNTRFGDESGDVTRQVEGENQKLGAAHAATGSYDSSYRGNNVDTVTKGGEAQIRDLGTELQDNLGKIAAWVTSQKSGFDAQKGGIDSILSHLGEETNPDNLSQIRAGLDQRIADLRAGAADNNTMGQNRAVLDQIAPTSTRAQALKTTLSQIVAGNADTSQKAAIGAKLIQSAGLSPQEQQQLATEFQTTLGGADQKQQTV